MPEEKSKNRNAAVLRYSGLGAQLLVLLGLGVWLGLKLDARLGLRALFVIIFPVLALSYSLWQLIRTLNKPNS